MRFPIEMTQGFSPFTGLLVAFAVGIGFGFMLERGGFGNARKLAAQFYLKDFAVLKVMFTAIVVAGTGFWWLVSLGMLDLSLTYINPTFLFGQIAGGFILGVGFIVAGYCPGTSCVAAATGRIDGLFTLLGVTFGILVYSLVEPLFDSVTKVGAMGEQYVWKWLGVAPGVVVLAAVLVAIGAFTLGSKLEKKNHSVVQPD